MKYNKYKYTILFEMTYYLCWRYMYNIDKAAKKSKCAYKRKRKPKHANVISSFMFNVRCLNVKTRARKQMGEQRCETTKTMPTHTYKIMEE